MAKHQLLNKYKYQLNEAVERRSVGLEREYQRRINDEATVVTNLYPKLFNQSELGGSADPLFMVMTQQIKHLRAEIAQNSLQLTTLKQALSDAERSHLVKRLVVDEIIHTNAIEDVSVDATALEAVVNNPVKRVTARLSGSVRRYLAVSNRVPLEITKLLDFRVIYDDLLENEIGNADLPDGRLFRDREVRIGTPFKTTHEPPKTEIEINEVMVAVISFRNTLSVDPVFKAIITHFMFENTHPFNDGIGRFGRYVLASDLAQSLDELTGLSISTEISKNVRKYYKAFQEASRPSNRAEATLFVQEMLAIINAAQQRMIAYLSN